MKADCYPLDALPHVSPLFRDYAAEVAGSDTANLNDFYSHLRNDRAWMSRPPALGPAARRELVDLLRNQNTDFGAGPAALSNIDRLGEGAAAVVTGQQVGLFGGPLLTLAKAATAIRLAADASRAGHPHVPIFWLATEDHDFKEINRAVFPDRSSTALVTLQLPANPGAGKPVGDLQLGPAVLPVVKHLRESFPAGPVTELLASLYAPGATLASAFGGFISRVFSEHGLIVIDASSRAFHALAHGALRAAIEQADALHAALIERSAELERAGYHAQVLVAANSSLLFLLDEGTGVRTALKKAPGGNWSAGSRPYSTDDLLKILDTTPERLSPNALLRPVLQDTLLPTAAYVGGPAEIAYFAQSDVVYRQILGRTTPVLPRLSATLIEPRIAHIMDRHRLALPDIFTSSESLALRLAAEAMPIEAKRKLAATGNALERELKPLTEWMRCQDEGLGHAADIAASKMRYQMNRLRRLSANFILQREASLRRHAEVLCQALYPNGTLQERELAGAWFLAGNPSLPDLLVERAGTPNCPHQALYL